MVRGKQASQGLVAGDRGQAGALSGSHRDIAPEAREGDRHTVIAGDRGTSPALPVSKGR